MNETFDARGIFVRMAGEAEGVGRGGNQLDASDFFIHADFVAACAPHRNCSVHGFPGSFVGMAFEALRRVRILLKRYGVNIGENWDGQDKHHKGHNNKETQRGSQMLDGDINVVAQHIGLPGKLSAEKWLKD